MWATQRSDCMNASFLHQVSRQSGLWCSTVQNFFMTPQYTHKFTKWLEQPLVYVEVIWHWCCKPDLKRPAETQALHFFLYHFVSVLYSEQWLRLIQPLIHVSPFGADIVESRRHTTPEAAEAEVGISLRQVDLKPTVSSHRFWAELTNFDETEQRRYR